MNRLFSIGMIILCAISCTAIESNKTLTDVESYIMERPDSALSVLESMNREDLVTHRNKAHHALLHAMALDKNYIDVTDDSIAKVAVDYYQKHRPQRNRARALYYMGISYYNCEKYDEAMLAYTKAEKIALNCDSLYLGMIYSAKSYTYNCTYNSFQELLYAQKAYKIFSSIKAEQYLRIAQYRLAVSYHNNDDYNNAIHIYDGLIKQFDLVDSFYISCLLGKAHSMIELDDVDYKAVERIFRRSQDEYNAELEEKDYWAWIYSLYRIGNIKEANQKINELKISDEFTANFWKARIAAYLNDYKAVYEYDNLTVQRQDEIVEELLKESLATYQSDYYQSKMELAEYKVYIRNLQLIAIIVLAILVLIVFYLLVKQYIIRQQEEKNKLLEYAEEIKRQLEEAEKNDYSELKKRFLSLYKSRFETIGMLSDQYHQSEGRVDIESVIYKKVVVLINEIKNDSENRIAFERMLDNDLDMIMTRLRTEIPKMKELDYAIFSYLIVGFDATTISRLLDISVNNVYAHKRRIRVKIEDKQPEHANQFLEMLS